MKVYASKQLPSSHELARILKEEFAPQYSYKLFGIGKVKSIMVQKSHLVGVQISKNNNEFTIVEMCPSVSTWLLSILALCAANLFIIFSPASYKKLEKDVSSFLHRKYN
jgi:hypothetical protein